MSNPSALFRTPATSARPVRVIGGLTPQNVGTGVLDTIGNVSDARDEDDASSSGSVGGATSNTQGSGRTTTGGTNAPQNHGQQDKFVRVTDVPDSAMLDIDVCL